MSVAKYVDDRDSSIVYSNYGQGLDWEPHVGAPEEYMRTTSLARKSGVNATITFFGTSIGVYGTVSEASRGVSSSPTSVYILDRNAPTSFTATAGEGPQYNILFYQSSGLEDGEHVLQIINQSEGGFFWLDYFIVMMATLSPLPDPPQISSKNRTSTLPAQETQQKTAPVSVTPFSTSTAPSSPGESTSSKPPRESLTGDLFGPGSGASSHQSSIPTQSISGPSSTTQGPRPPTSAIVGGVLGSTLGILILLILLR